jgi:hypothetical protein
MHTTVDDELRMIASYEARIMECKNAAMRAVLEANLALHRERLRTLEMREA